MKPKHKDAVLEKFKLNHPHVEITPAFLAGWKAADDMIKKREQKFTATDQRKDK